MFKILKFVLLALLIFSPFWRLLILKFPIVYFVGLKDIILYFKDRKYKQKSFPYGIDVFCGMFGHGKTLSMTHRANQLYKAFKGEVLFISNYKLKNIPHIDLISFKQLVDLGEDQETSCYKYVVVCIDEIETVLNNRKFAQFPLEMLTTLCQMRKRHIYIMASSPRFFQIDKLFRSITTRVYMCDKFWRFQHMQGFDAWDLENAMNHHMLKRLVNIWWFVLDRDYNSYDTEEMISKTKSENFISNDENITRKGLDAMANVEAVVKPSKKYIRRKAKQK